MQHNAARVTGTHSKPHCVSCEIRWILCLVVNFSILLSFERMVFVTALAGVGGMESLAIEMLKPECVASPCAVA